MPKQSQSPAWSEQDRLSALRSYGILDTEPERAFDEIVQLAGQLLEAPIVAVNLIDADRQWFKSELGLGVREMPLDDSICKFALLESERMVVPDTRDDARFACNPLVTGGPGLRFYAGELLMTAEGLPLGTLCVLDTIPRPQGLTPTQALALKTLAQQVLTQLELRKVVCEQAKLLVEQRHMHEALKRAQDRSRLATDAAGLGVWSWDPVADLVTWENDRPYEILGLTPSDAPRNAKQFLRDTFHPDDAAAFATAVASTMKTGAPFVFEGRMRRKDGEIRWVEFHGKAQASSERTTSLILGVASDITARRLAQLSLEQSQARFENIVSEAATGVVQADRAGSITAVNRKFCEMLGYTRDELLSRNLLEITAAGSYAATLDALEEVAVNAAGAVVETQYLRKNGTLMWASSSVSAVRGPTQDFEGVVAIVVDITQSRNAEEGLRKLAADLSEADQRKSEFLATLAHELRNPLAPIRNGLEVLKLGGDNAVAVAKVRGMMERQVTQMVRLIDDLLDVARISGGKIELQKSVQVLRGLIVAAIETSQPAIERGGHTLIVRHSDQELLLNADPTRIVQVLSNLLNNASKYTPSGGAIEVVVQSTGTEVLISVADTGVGIPTESLVTIFDMFNQIQHGMHRSQGGLGVGLSLVKRLVELHGGSVDAASEGSGAGSIFTVRLPLAYATQRPSPLQSRPEQAPARRTRVLIADDNVDAAQSLAAILDIQGHETRVAHSGEQALEIAEYFVPEISFLDIGMPGMNGYETAVAMRKLPRLQHATLVALTGWGNESDRTESKRAGFDHHITKPADATVIARLLEQVANGEDKFGQSMRRE